MLIFQNSLSKILTLITFLSLFNFDSMAEVREVFGTSLEGQIIKIDLGSDKQLILVKDAKLKGFPS